MGRLKGSKPKPPVPWTDQELNHAKLLFGRGYSFWKIGQLTGRTLEAVRNKLFPAPPRDRHHRDLPKLKADAAARREAADQRDMTSTFFGDPPRGYSALDQMRGGRG